MSGYPVVLAGEAIEALVVGGGAVAERKARAVLAAGGAVRVVAPAVAPGLRALADDGGRLVLVERAYRTGDIGDAILVFAATDDAGVNARVAADARAARRLVNVVDDPDGGDFITVALHRAGDVVIAVSAGGVPTAAARIRDAIAERFDDRYAAAVSALATLRRRLLDGGQRAEWQRAAEALVTDGFCARVESGRLTDEVRAWP